MEMCRLDLDFDSCVEHTFLSDIAYTLNSEAAEPIIHVHDRKARPVGISYKLLLACIHDNLSAHTFIAILLHPPTDN